MNNLLQKYFSLQSGFVKIAQRFIAGVKCK
jgi:hypothetical protein